MRTVGPWAGRLEAVLVALLLAAMAGLAALEASSGLAATLRSGRALRGLITVPAPDPAEPPGLFFLAYHPALRTLDVIELPRGEAPQPKGKTLEQLYRKAYAQGGDARAAAQAMAEAGLRLLDPDGGLGPLDFARTLPLPALEPSLGHGLRRLAARPRGLHFLAGAAREARRCGPPLAACAYEAALLSAEAYRLAPGSVRPVFLPAAAHRQQLLETVLSPAPAPAEPSELRTDVLNASGETGVAQNATKVLRSLRVDVIDIGNAAAEPETRIVDRAGRPNDARLLSELLGCPDVPVWTQFDPAASAQLAVLLGEDFRRCRGLAGP